MESAAPRTSARRRWAAQALAWLSMVACGGAPAPSAQVGVIDASSDPPTLSDLLAALGETGAAIERPVATSVELDGAPPAETILLGLTDDGTQRAARLWVFRGSSEALSLVGSETHPLDDPGTFEADPGLTIVHVMPVAGGREIAFLRLENAQGGADPRTMTVDVDALSIEAGALAHGFHCRASSVQVAGPDRDTVFDDERVLAFDDAGSRIVVTRAGQGSRAGTYRFVGGEWRVEGDDVCANER